MHRFLYPLLLIALVSCSSSPDIEVPEEIASLENLAVFDAETEPTAEVSLDRVATFGDTEDVFLGSWLISHVDDRGRVYIADMSETVLHLYNPDGTYNRQIGGEGDGPGEYRNIAAMQTDENYLHLLDRNVSRITRYDIDTFEVVDDLSITYERDTGVGFFRSLRGFELADEKHYLVHFGMGFRAGNPDIDQSERRIQGELMNRETGEFSGENVYSLPASEALVEFRGNGSMAVMSVPYKRSSAVVFTENGFVHGWSENFLFKFYDNGGTYRRSVYYDYPNPPLDRDEILEMYADRDEMWRQMVQNDEMPQTWPSWHSFQVDDEGRIWVERTTENSDKSEYHVLESDGTLLATFPWERGDRVVQILNGHLYALEENDVGLRQVVKYRVTF